jgi:hypothetical protein
MPQLYSQAFTWSLKALKSTCLISDGNDKLNVVCNDYLNNLPSIEEDLSMLNNNKAIWVMHTPSYGGILDKTMLIYVAAAKQFVNLGFRLTCKLRHILSARCYMKDWVFAATSCRGLFRYFYNRLLVIITNQTNVLEYIVIIDCIWYNGQVINNQVWDGWFVLGFLSLDSHTWGWRRYSCCREFTKEGGGRCE